MGREQEASRFCFGCVELLSDLYMIQCEGTKKGFKLIKPKQSQGFKQACFAVQFAVQICYCYQGNTAEREKEKEVYAQYKQGDDTLHFFESLTYATFSGEN